MQHPIIEDLRWRHTCNKYDPQRRVNEADLAVLFEALRLSASSINSQPWRFVVIESPTARGRLLKTFGDKFPNNQPHVFDASQVILLAHNPRYRREDYAEIVDNAIADGRVDVADRDSAFRSFVFAEMNTDARGNNACWTRAQLYLALGNALHVLARLKIDATPLEGIDADQITREFAEELHGYRCDVALAIGYAHADDANAKLPKSRRRLESLLRRI